MANASTKQWLGNREAMSGDCHIIEPQTFQNTGHGWWNEGPTATTVRTPQGGGSLEANVVAVRLAQTNSNGWDVNTDGTTGTLDNSGGGAVAFDWQSGGDVRHNVSEKNTSALQANQTPAVLTFDKQRFSEYGDSDVASTVSARDYKDATDLVVFQQNQRDEVRDLGDVAGALQAQPGMKQQNYLAYSVKTAQTGSNGWGVGEEVMGTLDGANGFAVAQPLRSNVYNNSDPGLDAAMQIYSASGVRRLTPTECCRLQGFPDDWNAYGVERRAMYSEPSNLGDEAEIIEWETVPQSDSARYKQLGNAVTVSVAKWIGQQIMRLRKEEDSE